jgi:hypothetical protein
MRKLGLEPRTTRSRVAIGGAVLAATAAGGLAASQAIALAAGPDGPGSSASPVSSTAPTGTTAPTGPAPRIRLRGGRLVAPTTGDWEGTVDGLPASFDLVADPAHTGSGGAPYGIAELVALQPSACPASAAHVSEAVLETTIPVRLRRGGTLGLARFGFNGEFTGAASATLTRSFTITGCHGTEIWHMHPATRTPVSDGSWTVHYADGVSGHFSVNGGGRVAQSLPLPKSLGLCENLTGTADMFIGDRGRARSTGSALKIRASFARAQATGRLISSGSGCHTHTVHFTARRVTARHAG